MTTTKSRWFGLKTLLEDAVEHGSRAVEKVHLETATRTFDVLEAIPKIATTAKVVRVVHDGLVTNTHVAIRLVNQGVHRAADAIIEEAGVVKDDRESR